MLRSCRKLIGYQIYASDGEAGDLYDLYFDDRTSRILHAVVRIGESGLGSRVLVHPAEIGKPDHARKELPMSLSRAEILNAPDWNSVKPVYRRRTSGRYSPVLNGTDEYRGAANLPLIPSPFGFGRAAASRPNSEGGSIRSFREVSGYALWGADGWIGNFVDFVVADDTWQFPYIVVETGENALRRHVLIPSAAVRRISWDNQTFLVDIPGKLIRASPYFEPATAAR